MVWHTDGWGAANVRHGREPYIRMRWRRDGTLKALAGGVARHALRVTRESATIAYADETDEGWSLPTADAIRRRGPGSHVGRGLDVKIARRRAPHDRRIDGPGERGADAHGPRRALGRCEGVGIATERSLDAGALV
jgi:hypothetical protein